MQGGIEKVTSAAATAKHCPIVGFADVQPTRREQLGLPHEHELMQVCIFVGNWGFQR